MKIKSIPKSFKVFNSTFKIVFDNKRMADEGILGQAEHCMELITLADRYNEAPLSEDIIKDAFYHEKVHVILRAMGEHDLSDNEKFVDVFAKLWRQTDDTAEY